VTLVFSDMLEQIAERHWREVLRDHTVVGSLRQSYHGTVVKTRGDGFMLPFASCDAGTAMCNRG
jgi:class 3 adenylate cyclase